VITKSKTVPKKKTEQLFFREKMRKKQGATTSAGGAIYSGKDIINPLLGPKSEGVREEGEDALARGEKKAGSFRRTIAGETSSIKNEGERLGKSHFWEKSGEGLLVLRGGGVVGGKR